MTDQVLDGTRVDQDGYDLGTDVGAARRCRVGLSQSVISHRSNNPDD